MNQSENEALAFNMKNDRYARKLLRPIAKSVYQSNKIVRLNGSLNTAINSTMMDSNKAL